jgi:hypothetical protein
LSQLGIDTIPVPEAVKLNLVGTACQWTFVAVSDRYRNIPDVGEFIPFFGADLILVFYFDIDLGAY